MFPGHNTHQYTHSCSLFAMPKTPSRSLRLFNCLVLLISLVTTGAHAQRPDVYWGNFGDHKETSAEAICERHAAFHGQLNFSHLTIEDSAYYGDTPARGCIHIWTIDGESEISNGTALLFVENACPPGFTPNGSNCQAVCDQSQTWDPVSATCVSPTVQHSCTTTSANPIDFMEGKKYRREPVLSVGSVFPIELIYFYNSQAGMEKTVDGLRPSTAAPNTFVAETQPYITSPSEFYYSNGERLFGDIYAKPRGNSDRYWRHNYEDSLESLSNKTVWHRSDGHDITFDTHGASLAYPDLQLVSLAQGWKIVLPSGQQEYYFDALGRLTSVKDLASGHSHTLNYLENSVDIDTIEHSSGYFVQFSYAARDIDPQSVSVHAEVTQNYPSHIATSAGRQVDIAWDKAFSGRLQRYHLITNISFPYTDMPEGQRDFEYNNPSYPAAVTEIYDQADADSASRQLYAHFEYDTQGRATYSSLAEGVDAVSITYPDDNTRTVTNVLGKVATYEFAEENGVKRLVNVTGEPTATCLPSTEVLSYDGDGQVAQRTRNGQTTTYLYNDRGLESARTEASGTPEARTILTQWHADFNLPTQITEPNKVTHYTYNSAGQLIETRLESEGLTRTETREYNEDGRLITLNGFRNDVDDRTHFDYDENANLISVTNALDHRLSYGDYNSSGRPQFITDANGAQTRLAYHHRGWLLSSTLMHPSGDTRLDATTHYKYNGLGQLVQTRSASGEVLDYEYDVAQRLVAISNALGERYEFTLDAAGNPTAETIKNASDEIVYQVTRTYDELSRVSEILGSANQRTQFDYDANNNLTTLVDGRDFSTQYQYDALNRLTESLEPLSANTHYEYTQSDDMAAVTDARNLPTTYTYNGFDELIEQNSPDTGLTTFTYDQAGNRLSKTDAKGTVTLYTYDALNRLSSVSYPDSPELNITYTYDNGTIGHYGIGRLTQVSHSGGTTHYRYNHQGLLAEKTLELGTQTHRWFYSHNPSGQLVALRYPSGRQVHYQYDLLGRLQAIATQSWPGDTPQSLIDQVSYMPFGQVHSIHYSNGVTTALEYDQDYRLSSLLTGGVMPLYQATYTFDLSNNIDFIDNPLDILRNQAFAYDALSRLDSAEGTYGEQSYVYDPVGNRTEKSTTVNNTTLSDTYTYGTSSHRLEALSLGIDQSTHDLIYDEVGNLIADPRQGFSLTYNDANRLATMSNSQVHLTFHYNHLGQRVIKTTTQEGTTTTRYYQYDEQGHLAVESNEQGHTLREYLYIGTTRIALFDRENTTDTDGDGLGDDWEIQFFGNLQAQANDDPDGDGFTNLEEYHRGTLPNDSRDHPGKPIDSDLDGLRDAWELSHFNNLSQSAAQDFDGDGLLNIEEYLSASNPNLRVDSDNDGLPDEWESYYFGGLHYNGLDDVDNDDLNNATEYAQASNPIEDTNQVPQLSENLVDQNTIADELWTYTLPAHLFTDGDGDGLSYSAVAPLWLSFDSDTLTFSGTPTQNDLGVHNITVMVDDGHGGLASTAFDLSVSGPSVYDLMNNMAPTTFLRLNESAGDFADSGSFGGAFTRYGNPTHTMEQGYDLQDIPGTPQFLKRPGDQNVANDPVELITQNGQEMSLVFIAALEAELSYGSPIVGTTFSRSGGKVRGFQLTLERDTIKVRTGFGGHNIYHYAEASFPEIPAGQLAIYTMRLSALGVVSFDVNGQALNVNHYERKTSSVLPSPTLRSSLQKAAFTGSAQTVYVGRAYQYGLNGHHFPKGYLDGRLGALGFFDRSLTDTELAELHQVFLSSVE